MTAMRLICPQRYGKQTPRTVPRSGFAGSEDGRLTLRRRRLRMVENSCKVERVAHKYGLSRLDERVLRRREQEGASLRKLEAYINQRILRAAMEGAGMRVLEGDAENYHRILTEDDASRTAEQQVRRELEQEGVPVEEVLSDMVSYQTVRAHLNDCLDTDTSKDDAPPDPEQAESTFRGLQTRAENVVEKALNRFRKHDVIDIGSPHVNVIINVTCGDCGRTYGAYELLNRKQCECRVDTVSDTPTNHTRSK
jgi:hypothetical protein